MAPVTNLIWGVFRTALWAAVVALVAFVVGFFIKCRINPFRLSADHLAGLRVSFLPYDFFRWVLWDILTRKERERDFNAYGFTFFVGRQGSGKTISMVKYLWDMKQKYPNCKIVTNFACAISDHRMTDWRDLLEIRNGTEGVIFAIDEIHSEYSSASWKDFPESLLSEISQQRKQRVKIVATSQVFERVVKPLREQAFSVIVCETYLGRWVRNREYDAAEYATCAGNAYRVKKTLKPLWKKTFVQSNALRGLYDTYEKIERMQKLEFIPRAER